MSQVMNRSGLLLLVWGVCAITYIILRIGDQHVAAEFVLDGAIIGVVSDLLFQSWRRERAERG